MAHSIWAHNFLSAWGCIWNHGNRMTFGILNIKTINNLVISHIMCSLFAHLNLLFIRLSVKWHVRNNTDYYVWRWQKANTRTHSVYMSCSKCDKYRQTSLLVCAHTTVVSLPPNAIVTLPLFSFFHSKYSPFCIFHLKILNVSCFARILAWMRLSGFLSFVKCSVYVNTSTITDTFHSLVLLPPHS